VSDLIIEVCKIDKIEKHPNADRLALATIKGWNCVVGLNAKEGDLVVFCPPDSMIPMDLIEKHKLEYLKKDGRVKTVKLRGVISQGLILDIPEGKNWKAGQDVAKELGITKYEPPAPKYQQFKNKETIMKTFAKYCKGEISFRRLITKCFGIIKDKFKKKKNINPLFTKYTDINNINNYNTLFKDGEEVVITEKIHGTNFRAGYVPRRENRWQYKRKNQEFCYGSHNVQLVGRRGKQCWYGTDVYGRIAEKYKLAEVLPKDCIVYGEIYGKGIQKLEYGLDDIDIRFFDVKYKGIYLNYNDFLHFCDNRRLPMVPILYQGKLEEGTIEKYTKGDSILSRVKQIREGCVVKPLYEENNKLIGRKVLKSINPEYLLKKDRTDYH